VVATAVRVGVAGAVAQHGVPQANIHRWVKDKRYAAVSAIAAPTGSPARSGGASRRVYTVEEKARAVELVASGVTLENAGKAVGANRNTVSKWCKAAKANGRSTAAAEAAASGNSSESKVSVANAAPAEPAIVDASAAPVGVAQQQEAQAAAGSPRSIYAPKDPGQGLAEYEVEAIVNLKKKHPSMQPAQIRAQLKRFKGWRLSLKAIARVFRQNGYELVHRGSRPQGPEPIRFEAPHRNALWQTDYTELRITGIRMHGLFVLDDFSRYCVAHALTDSPCSATAIETLRQGIARHGKPETIRTDRGGGFLSKEFEEYLEAELIDHMVGHSYHPQGGGKVESLIGTVKRELWDVEHFASREQAERRLAEFVAEYNEARAHMGIDGLTPADRFFGRADRVLDLIDAISRKRQGVLEMTSRASISEELCNSKTGAPMEVLRLVIVDGVMELRFCGAKVRLGPV
jgi:RNA-directed DNA polymerase